MLNYEVDPALLRPRVPAGTELDAWQGRTFASVVGFLFLRTRVLGIPIPFHVNFEEVNLRFYVRRRHPEGDRRGVVFVKELVPRFAIAAVARLLYGEKYEALPMQHTLGETPTYSFTTRAGVVRLGTTRMGEPLALVPGSQEEFVAEHYWGYAAQRNGGAVEYQVEHPPWRAQHARDPFLEGDLEPVYGRDLAEALTGKPASAFVAEGSAVKVLRGAAFS